MVDGSLANQNLAADLFSWQLLEAQQAQHKTQQLYRFDSEGIAGEHGQQHQAANVVLYLVWTKLELVTGETVAETQRHWGQVLPCQPTATTKKRVSQHKQQQGSSKHYIHRRPGQRQCCATAERIDLHY